MSAQQLTLVIAAVDRARPVIRSVQSNLNQLVARVKGMQQAFRHAGGSEGLGVLSQAFNRLAGVARNVLSTIQGLFRTLLGTVFALARQVSGMLVGAFQQVAGAATMAAGAISGALAAAFVLVSKQGLAFNATIAQGRVGLAQITGNTEAAGEALRQFQQFAAESLLTLQDVVSQGTQLGRAYGREGFGQVLPTLKAFDAVARANQVSVDRVRMSLLQFRQLIQRDFAQQEELNSIGENMGINVAGMLRQRFGTADTEELKKAKVDAKQVAAAIVAGMNEEFGSQASSLGRNLAAVLSGFQDAFDSFAGRLTERFGPRLTRSLDLVLTQFTRLTDNEHLIQALSVPFDLVASAIEAVARELPRFVTWLSRIVTHENVIRVLANVAGMILAIKTRVMEFLSLVSGGQTLGEVFTRFGQLAAQGIDQVIRIWSAFVAGVQYVADHREELWGMIRDGINWVIAAVETLIGAATVLFTVMAVNKIAEIAKEVRSLAGAFKDVARGAKSAYDAWKAGRAKKAGDSAKQVLGNGARMGGVGARALVNPATAVIAAGVAGGYELAVVQDRMQGKQDVGVAGTLYGLGLNPFWTPPNADSVISPEEHARVRASRGDSRAHSARLGIGQNLPNVGGNLQALGKWVIEQLIGKGGQNVAAAIPEQLKHFGAEMWGQMAQAYRTQGLAGLQRLAGEEAAQVKQVLDRALGSGGSVTGAGGGGDLPPSEIITGREGREASAGATGVRLSADEVKELLAARNAYFEALTQQAQAAAAAAPEAVRAVEEARRLIPVLVARQRDLVAQSRQLDPASKEYWELSERYWKIQEQVQQLQARGAKEGLENARKAAEKAASLLDARADLINAQVDFVSQFDPEAGNRLKQEKLIPALIARVKALQQPRPGETEEEAIRREMSVLGLKRQVLETAGISGRNVAHTLGGGTIPLFDRNRFQALWQQLEGPGGEQVPRAASLAQQARENAERGRLRAILRETGGQMSPEMYQSVVGRLQTPGRQSAGGSATVARKEQGDQRSVTINFTGGLSWEEIRRMIMAELDRQARPVFTGPSY